MSDLKYTVVEISGAAWRRATGQRPTAEEAEFLRLFGRLPNSEDEEYGVAKAVEEMQWLSEFVTGVAL